MIMSNINRKSIKNVFDKQFDPLENKINTIPQLTEYHPSLLTAYDLTSKEITAIINNSGEQSYGYKSMFKFLDFYLRLSDPRYKVTNEEIDLHYNYIRNHMFKIIELYENAAEYCEDVEEEKSLLEIVKKQNAFLNQLKMKESKKFYILMNS